jgi:hypothetical protein
MGPSPELQTPKLSLESLTSQYFGRLPFFPMELVFTL